MAKKHKTAKLPALIHGLYLGCELDMRTRPGKAIKKLIEALLERFPTPAPAQAQVIAQRCAFKLIRAASYEAFILKGGQAAPTADRDYLTLTGSIRADIQALWVMAKDGGTPDPVPDLATYLASLKSVNGEQS
jgi:hypothetical protein